MQRAPLRLNEPTTALDDRLRAIAEPNRRAILRLVRDEERTAGDIADRFSVTRSAISQHLKVLREAGLVDERRDGVRRFYRIRPEGLTEIRAFIADFWADPLDRLKALAESRALAQTALTRPHEVPDAPG